MGFFKSFDYKEEVERLETIVDWIVGDAANGVNYSTNASYRKKSLQEFHSGNYLQDLEAIEQSIENVRRSWNYGAIINYTPERYRTLKASIGKAKIKILLDWQKDKNLGGIKGAKAVRKKYDKFFSEKDKETLIKDFESAQDKKETQSKIDQKTIKDRKNQNEGKKTKVNSKNIDENNPPTNTIEGREKNSFSLEELRKLRDALQQKLKDPKDPKDLKARQEFEQEKEAGTKVCATDAETSSIHAEMPSKEEDQNKSAPPLQISKEQAQKKEPVRPTKFRSDTLAGRHDKTIRAGDDFGKLLENDLNNPKKLPEVTSSGDNDLLTSANNKNALSTEGKQNERSFALFNQASLKNYLPDVHTLKALIKPYGDYLNAQASALWVTLTQQTSNFLSQINQKRISTQEKLTKAGGELLVRVKDNMGRQLMKVPDGISRVLQIGGRNSLEVLNWSSHQARGLLVHGAYKVQRGMQQGGQYTLKIGKKVVNTSLQSVNAVARDIENRNDPSGFLPPSDLKRGNYFDAGAFEESAEVLELAAQRSNEFWGNQTAEGTLGLCNLEDEPVKAQSSSLVQLNGYCPREPKNRTGIERPSVKEVTPFSNYRLRQVTSSPMPVVGCNKLLSPSSIYNTEVDYQIPVSDAQPLLNKKPFATGINTFSLVENTRHFGPYQTTVLGLPTKKESIGDSNVHSLALATRNSPTANSVDLDLGLYNDINCHTIRQSSQLESAVDLWAPDALEGPSSERSLIRCDFSADPQTNSWQFQSVESFDSRLLFQGGVAAMLLLYLISQSLLLLNRKRSNQTESIISSKDSGKQQIEFPLPEPGIKRRLEENTEFEGGFPAKKAKTDPTVKVDLHDESQTINRLLISRSQRQQLERVLRRDGAASLIQESWHNHRAKKEQKCHQGAAIKLQGAIRQNIARKRVLKKRVQSQSIVRLQTIARQLIAERKAKSLLEHRQKSRAAVTLQGFSKVISAKNQKSRQYSALKLQSSARGILARNKVRRIRAERNASRCFQSFANKLNSRHVSAINLQTAWRANRAKKLLHTKMVVRDIQQNEAAMTLQLTARRWAALAKVKALKKAKLEAQKVTAASTFQGFFRRAKRLRMLQAEKLAAARIAEVDDISTSQSKAKRLDALRQEVSALVMDTMADFEARSNKSYFLFFNKDASTEKLNKLKNALPCATNPLQAEPEIKQENVWRFKKALEDNRGRLSADEKGPRSLQFFNRRFESLSQNAKDWLGEEPQTLRRHR